MSVFETMASHLKAQGIKATIVEAADTAREPIFITVDYQGKQAKFEFTPAQYSPTQTGQDLVNMLQQALKGSLQIVKP